jgi:hypothetical protein
MSGTTVRIREETREALREDKDQTGQGTQDLLARAVDQLRRSLILAGTNVAYARIRAESPEALDAEIREWDAVLADGLDCVTSQWRRAAKSGS